MYARYVTYRRGFKTKDCYVPPTDPASATPGDVITKRSAMQDLIDGKCPDIDEQVSIFRSEPTATAAPAGGSSVGATPTDDTSVNGTPTEGTSKSNAAPMIAKRFLLAQVLGSAVLVLLIYQ